MDGKEISKSARYITTINLELGLAQNAPFLQLAKIPERNFFLINLSKISRLYSHGIRKVSLCCWRFRWLKLPTKVYLSNKDTTREIIYIPKWHVRSMRS